MTNPHILIPAVTVAEWGGLHEWVAEATQWLTDAGCRVTVVARGDRFTSAVREAGATVLPVADWKRWDIELAAVTEYATRNGVDKIFTHGPQARALGIAAGQRLALPVYVMVHGAYHDYAFEWQEHAHRFITASPSLADYLRDVAKVRMERIFVVPNGLPRSVANLGVRSLDDKLAGGVGRIATASRLDRDKLAQIPVIAEVLSACRASFPQIHWRVDVYGDGILRGHFESALKWYSSTISDTSVVFHGWTPPENIPLRMNEAVIGVVAGLGGMRAVATGTLCVAVGARDVVGLQVGENLAQGIYSNFGDHGTQGYVPTPISRDLEKLFAEEGAYDRAVMSARELALRVRSSDAVRDALFSALDLRHLAS